LCQGKSYGQLVFQDNNPQNRPIGQPANGWGLTSMPDNGNGLTITLNG